MVENAPQQEIREEIIQTIQTAERIIAGNYASDYPSEDSHDPSEVFSGPLLDLNDATLNEKEVSLLQEWIEGKLGAVPDDAPIKGEYKSFDEQTTVTIYDVSFGQDEVKWLISRWQNEGEQPSYIFWAEEILDEHMELGFTEIDDEQ